MLPLWSSARHTGCEPHKPTSRFIKMSSCATRKVRQSERHVRSARPLIEMWAAQMADRAKISKDDHGNAIRFIPPSFIAPYTDPKITTSVRPYLKPET